MRDRNAIKMPIRYANAHISVGLLTENDEPRTYENAINSYDATLWRQAMDEEMKSLEKNNTWTLTDPPSNQKIIDNRWTFKMKKNADGSNRRYKARLVARGFNQQYGIDYEETFSPVVRFDSIRAILEIAACWKMKLQFDIKTAFLHGNLEETIFMKQPTGYNDGTNRVCKLRRSLYGLKQALRSWNQRFTNSLSKFRLRATEADPCVFTSREGESRLISLSTSMMD